MVWLKSCNRCGGDLYLEEDEYGAFVACFQCGGYAADFSEEASEGTILEFPKLAASKEQSA